MSLHQAGRLPEAAKLYSAVLAENPGQVEALHLLGVLRLQQGEPRSAVQMIGAALRKRPDARDMLGNLAAAQIGCGMFSEALASYDAILVNDGRNISALHGRGLALCNLGRFSEAIEANLKLLAIEPGHLGAAMNCARALVEAGRLPEALNFCDRIVAAAPSWPDAHLNRGTVLARLDRHEEAIESFNKVLALVPNHADAFNNLGNSLSALGRSDEAFAVYQRVLAIAPDHLDAQVNCGALLLDLGKQEEALAYFDNALALHPDEVAAVNARGVAMLQMGRVEEALAMGERALQLDPKSTDIYDLFLGEGQFEKGWRLYENRWRDRRVIERPRPANEPQWQGQKVDGTLLVWGEQGLGDQIIYASMIPELVSFADKVVVEVEPRLVSLFGRSFPGIEVAELQAGSARRPADAQISLGSLGQFLRRSWSDFPQPKAYLKADPDRSAALRNRLSDGRAVVGLSWNSQNAAFGKPKSARLSEFAPLLKTPGIRFVDLQYGDTAADREAVQRELGVTVERLPDIDNKNDIDGLAALMCACDAVVSVSNTNAHLAGALGRPTWVLVPHARGRIWYWYPNRPANPWYPALKVRRLGRRQGWADLVASVTGEVTEFLGNGARESSRE